MAIHWTEDFENGFTAWETYGLGNNFSIANGVSYSGSKSLYMPRPNGGFIDRFVPAVNRQFNLRFGILLGNNWATDPSNSKLIYVRADQSSEGYPNGVLEFIFGGQALYFALQGGFGQSDTINIPLNINYTKGVWKDVEFEWILNDLGSSNGSIRAWENTGSFASPNWVLRAEYLNRQDRGPSSTMNVNNIRLYSQGGSGDVWMDYIVMANERIGTGGAPPPPEVPLLPGPSNLQPNGTTPVPAGDVTVSWGAVPGATGYRLRIHKVGTPYEPTSGLVAALDQTGTSYTFQAEPSASYDWWVHTLNTDNLPGDPSGAIINVAAAPPPEEPPPDPLPGTFPETRTVTINWDAVVAADLAGYRIYRYLPADSTSPTMIELLGQVTTFSEVVPSNVGDVGYEISSFDTVGNESARSTKLVVPVDPPTAPPADTTPPAVPSNVSGSAA
jgi:hypothetical protein